MVSLVLVVDVDCLHRIMRYLAKKVRHGAVSERVSSAESLRAWRSASSIASSSYWVGPSKSVRYVCFERMAIGGYGPAVGLWRTLRLGSHFNIVVRHCPNQSIRQSIVSIIQCVQTFFPGARENIAKFTDVAIHKNSETSIHRGNQPTNKITQQTNKAWQSIDRGRRGQARALDPDRPKCV